MPCSVCKKKVGNDLIMWTSCRKWAHQLHHNEVKDTEDNEHHQTDDTSVCSERAGTCRVERIVGSETSQLPDYERCTEMVFSSTVWRHDGVKQNKTRKTWREGAHIPKNGAGKSRTKPANHVHLETANNVCTIVYLSVTNACQTSSSFLSASLYVSKRGAYWDRLCRDVVGRWLSRACTVAKRYILGL